MRLYPEITSVISESWQTGKWCDEVPLEDLTPMWADWENSPDRHFYVNEVAHTTAGRYVLPKRWVVVDGKECAEGHPVYFSERVSRPKLGQTCNLNARGEGEVPGQKERDHQNSGERTGFDIPRNYYTGAGRVPR